MRSRWARLLRGLGTALALASLLGTGAAHAQAGRPRLPLLVAHRAGTADAPENTLVAIRQALAHHSDGIWLTVQLSRDGVPVLYRPADLSALTEASGPVSGRTAAQLADLNAGYRFHGTDPERPWPYRGHPARIPTLRQALRAIPPGVSVFLDLKSLPAPPLVAAVARVLDAAHAWSRVRMYSTDASFQRLFAAYPRARLFESRERTRRRLFELPLSASCDAPPAATWMGLEWRLPVELTERFTLGVGRSHFLAHPWTQASVRCMRGSPRVHLMAFGVDDAQSYRQAACLGIDAVLVNSPARMQRVRAAAARGLRCPLRAAAGR